MSKPNRLRRRIRGLIKVCSIVLSLHLLAAWALGPSMICAGHIDNLSLQLQDSLLFIRLDHQPIEPWAEYYNFYDKNPGWEIAAGSGGRGYADLDAYGFHLPNLEFPATNSRFLAVLPLWCLFLVSAAPAVWIIWRNPEEHPSAHCRHCGYNLTSNVSGICPECGKKICP